MHDGERPIDPRYRALLEELMEAAEQEYTRAFAAIPSLPPAFQRPVAVAARVYRGIHAEIRRRGYDNLRRRAHTSAAAKLGLAARALWDLREARSVYRAIVLPDGFTTPRLERSASLSTWSMMGRWTGFRGRIAGGTRRAALLLALAACAGHAAG
jgi:hypothetical protein